MQQLHNRQGLTIIHLYTAIVTHLNSHRGPHNLRYKIGADPASKFRGGDLVVKSHNSIVTVREMKYTSQSCSDKTMDDKMALYRECCFPDCTKL